MRRRVAAVLLVVLVASLNSGWASKTTEAAAATVPTQLVSVDGDESVQWISPVARVVTKVVEKVAPYAKEFVKEAVKEAAKAVVRMILGNSSGDPYWGPLPEAALD